MKIIAITLHGSLSASHNTWPGILWTQGQVYAAPVYQVTHIVDRVGAGDAFAGGLIYGSSGANFVVGPVLNPEVARVCNRRKIAYSPGCGSASEISAAEELGVEICRIFPGAQVGGLAFVKAVLGPCLWTRLMPTGRVDVTQESIQPGSRPVWPVWALVPS